MVDVYREYLYINSVVYETMKEKLIEVFVSFYGEEYRGKITRVIDNILIILTGYGHDKKDIKKEIDKSKKDIRDFLINNYKFDESITLNKSLKEARILVKEMLEEYANSRDGENKHLNELVVLYNNYLYNSYILNKSKKNTYLYMMSIPNNKPAEMFYKQFIYNREEEVIGSFYPNLEVPLITVHGPRPNLTTIIHEVNHALHKEELIKYHDNKGIEYLLNSFGITGLDSKDDFIYEIINEYMAIMISSKYIEEYGTPIMQDEDVDSIYYQLDTILALNDEKAGPVLKLYSQAQDIIKKNLIEGNGFIIKDIIGNTLYNEINNKIKEVYNKMYTKYEENKVMISRDDIDTNDLLYLNALNKFVKYNLKEYRLYNKRLNGLVRKLENEGKIKQLKREN